MDWTKCNNVESKAIPVLIIPSVVCSLVAMTRSNWLEFYSGQLLISQVSPWHLCSPSCVNCRGKFSLPLSCFWVTDWSNTGFPSLTAVQHVEYFALGPAVLAFILALLSCVDAKRKYCLIDLHKPAIILLALSCLLSTISLSLFGRDATLGTIDKKGLDHVHRALAWPFYLRVIGAVFGCIALVLDGIQVLCCVKVTTDCQEEETAMFVTMPADELVNRAEEGMEV